MEDSGSLDWRENNFEAAEEDEGRAEDGPLFLDWPSLLSDMNEGTAIYHSASQLSPISESLDPVRSISYVRLSLTTQPTHDWWWTKCRDCRIIEWTEKNALSSVQTFHGVYGSEDHLIQTGKKRRRERRWCGTTAMKVMSDNKNKLRWIRASTASLYSIKHLQTAKAEEAAVNEKEDDNRMIGVGWDLEEMIKESCVEPRVGACPLIHSTKIRRPEKFHRSQHVPGCPSEPDSLDLSALGFVCPDSAGIVGIIS